MDETRRSFSAGLIKLAGTLLIPALVLLPLGGCSLAFVDGPASPPSPSRNACTTSYAAPTLDLLGVPATFLLGFAFGGFERSLEAVAPDDDDTFGNLEKAALAASGTLLVSGVYGLVQVGRCRGSLEASGGPPLLPNRFGVRCHGTVPAGLVPALSYSLEADRNQFEMTWVFLRTGPLRYSRNLSCQLLNTTTTKKGKT